MLVDIVGPVGEKLILVEVAQGSPPGVGHELE